jgi:hypothetical protein
MGAYQKTRTCKILTEFVHRTFEAHATVCRPRGTSHYSSLDYGLLMDVLAYDASQGFMNLFVMETKVLQLIQGVNYHSLKTLLRACVPRSAEKSLGNISPPRKNMWTITLTRVEVILYDEVEDHRFIRDVNHWFPARSLFAGSAKRADRSEHESTAGSRDSCRQALFA